MDITTGAPQTLNDIDIEDPNPNENQIASLPDLSRNPTINSMIEPEEYYEVVEKKEPVIGDQAEFMRMINEMKKNDKANQQKLENNKAHLKKKTSAKKQGESSKTNKIQESKNDRILRSIAPHVKNFKALNSSNSSDTQVAKLRAECKQKIFKYLLYGIEQLKDRKENELNLQQQRVSKLTGKDAYAIAKTLVIEIDVDFLNCLNSGNKQVASKKYKSHLKSLANNISDQTNLELRRKILAKEFTGKKLALLNEEQFYPPQVRQQLIQKQNILLREAAALDKPITMVAQQEQYHAPTIQVAVVAEQKKREEKKSKYKYLEESSILMLRDLLKDDQIKRMKNLLEFEARKDIQERLLNNINKVFDSLI